jgi:hypothetical protein
MTATARSRQAARQLRLRQVRLRRRARCGAHGGVLRCCARVARGANGPLLMCFCYLPCVYWSVRHLYFIACITCALVAPRKLRALGLGSLRGQG